MKFRVVRVFDRVVSATDKVAYRLETESKMTQGEAVELMDALNCLTQENLATLKLLVRQVKEGLDSRIVK